MSFFPRRVLGPQIWASQALRSATASDCEASASRVWSRSCSDGAESSSRWLAASSVDGSGRSGDSSLAAWGAAFMAGVVGVELGRSDGEAACCESADRPLASPMGKTPESKLAQPKFFLSG
jgi:hypothetical protein